MDLLTIVELATVVVTFIILISGLPVCVHMYKTGETKNVPFMLFLVYIFVNILGLKYAVKNDNTALIVISVVSLLVFGAYIAIYVHVSTSKEGPFAMLVALMAVYFGHQFYLDSLPLEQVMPTIGFYMLIWATILALVPFTDIMTMLREQSNESCDVNILVATTISGSTWLLYGLLLNDLNIWAPNVPALIICAVKFILLWYFSKGGKSVVHPVPARKPQNGFMGHDFHKEVYDVRARKPLQQ